MRHRWRHPCYFGIDIPQESELIAAGRTIQEVAEYIGVDSLGYLSLAGLGRAIHLNALAAAIDSEDATPKGCTVSRVPTDRDKSRNGLGSIHRVPFGDCARDDEQELKYLHEQFCYGCMNKEGWPFDPIAEAEHGVQHAIFFPRDTVGKRRM